MTRSLFTLLRMRYGPAVDFDERRRFLKASLAASGGLLLSQVPVWADTPTKVAPAGKSVVVIGGGFAGLACAFELSTVGYDVTVVEARSRVGGRAFSTSDFIPGKNIELGGELIGTNHPTWQAYAHHFGLELLEVTENDDPASIILDGKVIDDEQGGKLWEELDAAFNEFNKDAEPIDADEPWKSPNAEALDKMTVADAIDKLSVSDTLKKIMKVQLSADNAVDVAKQSYLGLLAAIKGGGLEKYWTDSETHRCKGGNQQLALKLRDALPAGRVITSLAVTKVKLQREKVEVTCADGRTIEADDVVLAIPPTLYSKITFSPMLPDLPMQMGVAMKQFNKVKGRYWETIKRSQYTLGDDGISWSWDGTDNQEIKEFACITAFSGAASADKMRALKGKARDEEYTKLWEKRYAGISKQISATRVMDWPSDPLVLGAYSFPAPGQITKVMPAITKGLGRLHFAGEHTCIKFAGYMEGALNSGATLARKLATRDGINLPVRTAPEPKTEAEETTGTAETVTDAKTTTATLKPGKEEGVPETAR